jgi:two-component system chemotaxis sensor kinase CheA
MSRILIVDDYNVNVFAMTAALTEKNYDTIGAYSGKECIKILNENSDISLILLDIMMPIMDGYETINAIKLLPNSKDIPIIVLTAFGNEHKKKALEVGANAILTKPIDLDALTVLIKQYLK